MLSDTETEVKKRKKEVRKVKRLEDGSGVLWKRAAAASEIRKACSHFACAYFVVGFARKNVRR